MSLEPMGAFFDARVDGYEAHMYSNVDGAAEYYALTADPILAGRHIDLLDLGCGTGLELDEIAKRNRDIRVVGIDLSKGMLSALRAKHGGVRRAGADPGQLFRLALSCTNSAGPSMPSLTRVR